VFKGVKVLKGIKLKSFDEKGHDPSIFNQTFKNCIIKLSKPHHTSRTIFYLFRVIIIKFKISEMQKVSEVFKSN
jgi:hypothetical protein